MTGAFKVSYRNVAQTPRKAGEVAALIRRRSLDDALVILEHTPRRAAGYFAKLLKSAQAAAKEVHRLEPASLTIDEVFVTAGSTAKRWRRLKKHSRAEGRGRGMAVIPWNNRSSHIFVSVSGQVKRPKAKAAAKTKEQGDGPES